MGVSTAAAAKSTKSRRGLWRVGWGWAWEGSRGKKTSKILKFLIRDICIKSTVIHY